MQEIVQGLEDGAIFPRPTRNKGSVIGCPRPKKTKWEGFGVADSKAKLRKRMKRNGGTVRGNLNRLLPLVKRVIAQEYVSQNGGDIKKLMRHYDLEHIHGKDGEYGGLPAVISPINLQLLDRETHLKKTEGLEISKTFDGRDKAIQERMINLAERIRKRAGFRPNWRDFKAAYEAEI
jgi:hypothetical protein